MTSVDYANSLDPRIKAAYQAGVSAGRSQMCDEILQARANDKPTAKEVNDDSVGQ